MNNFFQQTKWYIKENDGFTALDSSYEILDFENRRTILGKARQESCVGHKILKMFFDNIFLPFKICVEDSSGCSKLLIKREGSAFIWPIEIFDGEGKKICAFKQSFLCLKKRIEVLDSSANLIGEIISEDWAAKKLAYFDKKEGKVGTIKHFLKGVSREMFTASDDWVVEFTGQKPEMVPVLLAGAIVVDMLYHEA
ncbi:MAG: hypothetical protein HQM08_12140 [Candidatus Riflebacteria bacterium]|nr:hypothetical protein [Candidatus Riflebacteria bacterium]